MNKNMDLGQEVPPLIYVARGFSREDLKKTISHGRFPARAFRDKTSPPLWMPIWEKKISEEEKDALVEYLFSLDPERSASQVTERPIVDTIPEGALYPLSPPDPEPAAPDPEPAALDLEPAAPDLEPAALDPELAALDLG